MNTEKIDIHLTADPLSIDRCRAFVMTPEAGAEAYFVGTVRNATSGKEVQYLDFEAYAPMAVKEMKKIAEQAMAQWPILRVAVHHRSGHLDIGEIPVIIAVSSAHRDIAFKACQYCIDTLKETVPIWKKEVFEDGEQWVSAHP